MLPASTYVSLIAFKKRGATVRRFLGWQVRAFGFVDKKWRKTSLMYDTVCQVSRTNKTKALVLRSSNYM